MARGPLIVLSGPSGVGKTTLVDALLASTKLPLRRAVTATTRAPRPGEIPEVHYHFWDRPKFEEALRNGEMLEHALVHGCDYYGTPRMEVDSHRQRGSGVILVIDVQGAEQIRRQYQRDHVSIFLVPPNFTELENRLRHRGEPDESIQRRLGTAKAELSRAGEFNYTLMNDTLTETIARLEQLIRDQFPSKGE